MNKTSATKDEGNSRKDYASVGQSRTRDDLIVHLEEQSRVFGNSRLKEAFKKIDRADFVQPDYAIESYEDYALPIGYEQTISQPTTVAFMLELLEPNEGDFVLDIGSGSGWTTALLADIVGKEGRVLGLEIIPELVEQGSENLKKYDLPQATIEEARDQLGTSAKETYDRILVSADAEELPKGLLKQLKIHGIMVMPIKGAIYKIKKLADNEIQEFRFPGFAFVPLK